jgi:uncharacterized protein (DUF305 family)
MRFRQLATAVVVAVVAVFGAMSTMSPAATAPAAAVDQADADYMEMMIAHHYQAIVMSRLVPDRSSDSELESLANRIRIEQGVEIQGMQGWQGRNGIAASDPQEVYEEMLQDPEMVEMMGMATPAQLQQLESSQGEEFDILFLQLMIRHHQGAIDMSVDIVGTTMDEFVFQTAMDIIDSQSTQIDIMNDMLDRKTS